MTVGWVSSQAPRNRVATLLVQRIDSLRARGNSIGSPYRYDVVVAGSVVVTAMCDSIRNFIKKGPPSHPAIIVDDVNGTIANMLQQPLGGDYSTRHSL